MLFLSQGKLYFVALFFIRKACPCDLYPLAPHFWGLQGYTLFIIFYLKNFILTAVKNCCILHGHILVMWPFREQLYSMSPFIRKPPFAFEKRRRPAEQCPCTCIDKRNCFRRDCNGMVITQRSWYMYS